MVACSVLVAMPAMFPACFANTVMPTKLETERADAQKRADQFFNRKTKTQADKALLYLQKYRPDLAIGIYTRALITAAKADLSKKENRQKVARLLTLIGRSFKLDENDIVSCSLYRTARKFDPDDTTNKAFLLESLIPTAQFEEALKLSKELDAIKGDNATILRALSNQALYLEDYEACNIYLARALSDKTDPLRYISYRLLAQCRIRQGIEDQVAELFKKSAEAAESPYEQELAYGSSDLAAANPADAEEHFQRASRMLPEDIAWQSGRAQAICTMPNRQNDALDEAIAAVQKRRLTNRSMTLLANALQGHNQPKDADKCLARLKSLKPWSWHPFLAAGRMVRSRGDNAGARKELAEAQRINPKSGATALEVAASYQCEGNLKEAMNVCKKKLVDCPKSGQLWIKRGQIGLALKDFADSKESYERALGLIPSQNSLNVVWKNEAATSHAGLGTLAYIAGDKDKAIKEARQFNELKFIPVLPPWLTILVLRPNRISFKPTDSKKETEANNHTVLADMLLETRELKSCVEEYAKAVELNPSDVDLHSYYLNALVENNNWVEAAKEDVVLSSKLVGRTADHVAKWAKDKSAKKDSKKGTGTAPQGQKNGQGS